MKLCLAPILTAVAIQAGSARALPVSDSSHSPWTAQLQTPNRAIIDEVYLHRVQALQARATVLEGVEASAFIETLQREQIQARAMLKEVMPQRLGFAYSLAEERLDGRRAELEEMEVRACKAQMPLTANEHPIPSISLTPTSMAWVAGFLGTVCLARAFQILSSAGGARARFLTALNSVSLPEPHFSQFVAIYDRAREDGITSGLRASIAVLSEMTRSQKLGDSEASGLLSARDRLLFAHKYLSIGIAYLGFALAGLAPAPVGMPTAGVAGVAALTLYMRGIRAKRGHLPGCQSDWKSAVSDSVSAAVPPPLK